MEASLWVTSTSSHDNDFSLLKSHLKLSQNYTRSHNRLYLEFLFFFFFFFFPPNQNGQSKPFLWKKEEDNFADWMVVLNVFELGKLKHMTRLFKVQHCCAIAATARFRQTSCLHFANTTSHWQPIQKPLKITIKMTPNESWNPSKYCLTLNCTRTFQSNPMRIVFILFKKIIFLKRWCQSRKEKKCDHTISGPL